MLQVNVNIYILLRSLLVLLLYLNFTELRFVVLGKTGVGKSSSINTIVGKDVCRVTVSSSSVTKQCQLVEDDVLGKHLVIVDTLGLYDTESTEEETRKEIGKIIGLTSPGFHAFVVVIRIGRFTREEIQSVYILADMFGPELYERTVLLFTCIDHLEADELTFPAYLRNNINKDLKDLITKCGGRVVGFNNRVRGDTRQIDELMSKLSTVDIAKHGSYYTNQMYRDAKQILDEEENRRLEKDRTKCRSGVRQEIRYDIAEETSFGKKILNVLIDKIAVPAAEALVNAGKKAIGKVCVLS